MAVGAHAHRRTKNDQTKGRGFDGIKKMRTKQNQTKKNITPEKVKMALTVGEPKQMVGGYKFAPLVAY